jgi:hypothetical protein
MSGICYMRKSKQKIGAGDMMGKLALIELGSLVATITRRSHRAQERKPRRNLLPQMGQLAGV